MAKLIYALTKAGFETAYSDLTQTGPIYRSVAFTSDGYLWTHGKFFRIFDASNPFDVTYASGANVATGNIVSLKDASGTVLTTFDIGVRSITQNAPISVSFVNGVASITHDTSITAGTIGAASGTPNTTVVVPSVTYNNYGHITATGSVTATLNHVLGTTAISGTGSPFYLLGHAASATGTAAAYKISTIYGDHQGWLTATKFIGALNYDISVTLNGAAASVFNNMADKVFSFYAPTTSGTSGQVSISQGAGVAPSWLNVDTTVTNSSSNLITSGAVYTAVNAAVATADAMVYKGTRDASATGGGLPAAQKGDTYKISVAGTFNDTKTVEIGDMIICNTDATAAVAYASIVPGTWNNWDIVQTNLVSTTLGLNLLNFANPDVVSFIRINANNTVTAQTAANFKTDLSLNNVENTALTTWIGNTFISSVGNITTGTWNATAIGATKGGTGQTGYVLGDLLYASSTTALSKLAGNITTTKKYLSQTGTSTVSAAPTWEAISGGDVTGAALTKTDDTNVTLSLGGTPSTALLRAASLTLGWSGTLSAARGGTGYGTYAVGDMLYANTTTTLAKIAKPGVDGYILRYNTGTNTPYWSVDSNTWRNISAYKLTTNTLVEILSVTIGGADLQFGSEFLWTSDSINDNAGELKLGWAEVDGSGVVTYAV